MSTYTTFNSDLKNQINFIKGERNELIKFALSPDTDPLSRALIVEKIKLYAAIEQNMYALKALAPPVLKPHSNKLN